MVRYRRDFYRGGHPTPEDVLLLIEVADSSLPTDRAIELPLYARHYRQVRTVRADELLKPAAVTGLEITAKEIFGS